LGNQKKDFHQDPGASTFETNNILEEETTHCRDSYPMITKSKSEITFHVYYLPFTRTVKFCGAAANINNEAKKNISGFLYASYMKHENGSQIKPQDGASLFVKNGKMMVNILCDAVIVYKIEAPYRGRFQ